MRPKKEKPPAARFQLSEEKQRQRLETAIEIRNEKSAIHSRERTQSKKTVIVVNSISEVVHASIRISRLPNKRELFARKKSYVESVVKQLDRLRITDPRERLEKALELMEYFLDQDKGKM